MTQYQNILVAIDPDQDDQPALRRAVYLNQRLGGKITAFLAIYDLSYELTTALATEERESMRQEMIQQRTEWLRYQSRVYLEFGVDIALKVIWHNRQQDAILQEIETGSYDLVLKMAHQNDRLESVIFTPTDWLILRKSPCPVWMVKDQPWPTDATAVVAVNLASDDQQHDDLNRKLVRETQALASQLNHTAVRIVGAYPLTPVNLTIELPDFDAQRYSDAVRGQYLLAMKALRQPFSIDSADTYVEQGEPEEVIPEIAAKLNAGVVVLGTFGRSGFSAAFLGNTAEQVIDHLRCDLLVMRPDVLPE
ncbi:universal stress protein UspE [Rosenbergiella sp. S61]|uniref:Universal stress protein E n=1 Tax=Rosenbergiella gaditana TaxID=2726987 RepID=A0ABS5SV04_9GAMM|nr:universal stress protein UspE [Rosenbergiella gaditana]MBT0723077.1 universal stress protein UspE [Rosenbergiella gaditana]